MRITVGNPVEGENFYGREREMGQLWERLANDHVLMLAPRRIGKTSLLKRLRDTGEAHKVSVVVCSFAGCNAESDCIKKIVEALSAHTAISKTAGGLKDIFSRVKSVKVGSVAVDLHEAEREPWRAEGEALDRLLKKCDHSVLICVDELPIFVLEMLKNNDVGRARSFLNWFRDLRQQHTRHVKWILAGSIGLDTVAKRFRMGDTINDLSLYPIGAFTEDVAQGLLEKLASSNNCIITQEVCLYIIKRVGWPAPYYLQVMFRTIKDNLQGQRNTIEKKDVDNAFEELMSPAHKNYFDYWRQRLADELGSPQDGWAILLLNALCQDPTGSTKESLAQVLSQRVADPDAKDEQLNYVLDVLESDGYITVVDGRYRFRMVLLQEYWKRRVAT
ncbi:MAG: ATP-binding protein [Magnetococcales bacterium]|nr:ATP-binding protein [Magnetococcales bacterium]